MQKTFRSFIKNGKERKNVAFFWKERVPNPENTTKYHQQAVFFSLSQV